MTFTLLKKSHGRKAGPKAKAGDPIPNYGLLDNEDGSFTILGLRADGTTADISAIASLTPPPVSDNPAVLTVDPPAGMTDQCHGLSAGTANVACTATWNDGSVGPFNLTVPCTVAAHPPGPITGLAVTFGVPTVRP